MRKTLAIVMLLMKSLAVFSQSLPDTIGINYNSNLAGSQWQYSFVQITDIHIGEGAPGDDYGTVGFNDNTSPSDAGDPLIRLRNSVAWINQHLSDLKIHFVVVTGDMSESAEVSELLRCKQVLDYLNVPYIPLIGNHDVWPLSQGVEEIYPSGDSLFNVLFANVFTELQSFFPGWNNGTRLLKTWHPDHSCYSYFQNFTFNYGSYYYMCADFVSRAHDIALFNGAAADAELHNFAGGTWPWLQQTISNYPDKGQNNLLIFAHHPLSKDLTGSYSSFSYDEYDDVTQYLKNYSSCLGAWIAGHKHNVDEYSIKTWTFSPEIAVGYEAAANWEYPNGHFRIFRMWDTVAPAPLALRCHDSPRFLIFPNPCNDYIQIEWGKNTVPETIELYDSRGNRLNYIFIGKNADRLRIDMDEKPSGLYLLKICGETVHFKSFIKS